MGDISEMRGIIIVGSFIGVFVIIASLIPSGFFFYDYEGKTIEPPPCFEAIDLQSYAETWTYTMNETGGTDRGVYYEVGVDTGGHDFNFEYRKANASTLYVRMRHWFANWIFPTQHTMEWINKRGITQSEWVAGHWSLYATELDEDYANDYLPYTVQCWHFHVDVHFGYNETLYSSPSDAWNSNALNILIGIEFDQQGTSMNAWHLIALILFFQMPDIHWVVNAIIAVPIWIAVAYLSFILILRAIGAVFGGGGA